ncbi:MAG: cellulase family glycosylhydrolase [Atopobiaceae bacterium]|jgi:glucan 1,3-beta-glucosidase|nr:cellulase family glycosylhydrolase [Atopobiaceae bacterium]MCH4180156.1 cellulase family glycosylhydrolase [Atopobiaceae bacterium]MCH4214326.1 cellulase family glycosylhydrolase [Atopobiaceae bacterium]MCH4230648.1 cellulase family glycosylhydrolase [Atopobiaceae bacterium]MCH4276614.1 cellulase family glycosylhydrolase [Atopobiaceae bacterium]
MAEKDDRTVHGVNLSGWLVLESWVTPSLFASTGAFDGAGLREALGRKRFSELLDAHRSTFITEEDFSRIAARGFDAVRLPVPWFVLGDDGPFPGSYDGCLKYVDAAMNWAEDEGIQVLLCLSSIPGSTDSESGHQMVIQNEERSRAAALEVISVLAERFGRRPGLLGIEPLDEPQVQHRHGLTLTDGVPMHRLRNYYRDAYETIRQMGGHKPVVVISDGGMPGEFRRFMAQDRYTNVWLDSHIYHYADSTDASGPRGVRDLITATDRYLKTAHESHLPCMVGEWSAALPLADSAMTPEGRIALERVYTSSQLSAFAGSAGWFFQTWKTESHLSSWDARVALSSFERGMFD